MLIRRRFSALGLTIAVLAASVILLAGKAHAGNSNCITDPNTNQQVCSTSTSTPGSGDTGTSSGGVCMDASASVTFNGTTYPCSQSADNQSWWYVGGGCYSAKAPATAVPPPGDPAWGGHSPADNGIIVYRSCQLPPSVAGSTLMWERCIGNCVNFGPQYLLDALGLTAPGLTMAPPSGTQGLVKQNVWFWSTVDMSDRTQTVTSGANSITGTRTLTSVVWSWGDGNFTRLSKWPDTCRPYTPADAGNPAPSGCGHTYAKASPPGKPYQISVTVQWAYTYSINGGPVQSPAAGRGPQPMTSTATITIAEGQSTNG